MAHRIDFADLKACLDSGGVPPVVDPYAVASVREYAGIWHRICGKNGEYKTAHSANAAASIFRRKLGAGYRLKSIGTQVYVVYDGAAVQGAAVLENAA